MLSTHFSAREFYSHSSDAPDTHPLYMQLVDAAEFLRTYFGVAWRITSSFRTESNERQILARLGVPFFVDEHMKGRAIDSQPAADTATNKAIMLQLAEDFTSQGVIYQALRSRGITGFGLYNTFIHLDCRVDNFKAQRRDSFGLVACWDSRTNVTGKRFGGETFSGQKKSPLRTSPTTFPVSRRPSSATASR